MAGFDLFTSITEIPGVEYVLFAILSGCNTPDSIAEHLHTLPYYPYIDTDVTLESVADTARKLTGTESSGNTGTERKYAIDTIRYELGEWK